MKAAAGAVILTAVLFIITAVIAHTEGSLPAGGAAGEEISVPVLMYHSILRDPDRTGEYVITPESLERDMEYLSDKGYTAVSCADAAAYARGEGKLPEKPVILTFDDGHYNNKVYLLPLLEKYGMCATINIVGAFTEQAERENDPNPGYAYLTRWDIRELALTGRVETGCHTYNMHSMNGRRGAKKNDWETEEEYAALFSADTDRWLSLMEETGINACVYAYPYGYYSSEGFELLSLRGFQVILTCEGKDNLLCRGSLRDEPLVLNRYNRSGLAETVTFMESIGIT